MLCMDRHARYGLTDMLDLATQGCLGVCSTSQHHYIKFNISKNVAYKLVPYQAPSNCWNRFNIQEWSSLRPRATGAIGLQYQYHVFCHIQMRYLLFIYEKALTGNCVNYVLVKFLPVIIIKYLNCLQNIPVSWCTVWARRDIKAKEGQGRMGTGIP